MAAFIASEVAAGLDYAHRQKDAAGRPLHIVHRDVSPANILLSWEGEVKLADFGIAKVARADALRGPWVTAGLKGNLGYMAPEQLARAPVSPATDVYAAGVLLWELLTGRRLFAAAFELAASAEARQRPIAPPSTLNPAVPPALDAVCARATALAPGDRFADGAAMAQALEPTVHALGFGPTQLAALMRDFGPPPVDDEPARHTVTVAGATATVVDPPRITPPRRARFAIAAALGAAAGIGAFVGWPRHVEELAPPPSAPSVVATAPRPIATPLPTAATPRPTAAAPSAPHPSLMERRAATKAPPAKKAGAPDFVDGKLLNPFQR
jgi:hypothetical protein